ncbi:phage holin family protein [Patescibacteria group bacterium]|nr:phage holin family protein [Patescibacteria group bacterium]
MKILVSLVIKTLAVVITAFLLPGVTADGLIPAIWLVVVLVPIDYIIKPILHLLTLPISIITLGLFALIINGLMVLLAASLVPGFEISSLFMGVLFAIILGFFTAFLQNIFIKE